jgi:hypothetical protein
VLSVFGRAGSVVAALGDYTSSLITNASGVAGVTVTAALDALQAALDAANTAIGSKADTTYVNTQLATKADAAATTTSLAAKANTADVNTALATKADTTYVNTQLATKADRVIASVVYTAAATTLQAADADRSVGIDSALSNTLTIPPGVFPVGQVIAGTQLGVGRTQFLEGAGVTIRSRLGRYTGGQFAVWTIYQRSANVWELSGDLVSS